MVLASILLEAGLSALAGVGVFLVGLVMIGGADVPLVPLGAFGCSSRSCSTRRSSRRSRAACCARSAPRR